MSTALIIIASLIAGSFIPFILLKLLENKEQGKMIQQAFVDGQLKAFREIQAEADRLKGDKWCDDLMKDCNVKTKKKPGPKKGSKNKSTNNK